MQANFAQYWLEISATWPRATAPFSLAMTWTAVEDFQFSFQFINFHQNIVAILPFAKSDRMSFAFRISVFAHIAPNDIALEHDYD